MKIAARALFLVFFITVVASPNESTALLRGVVLDQAGGAVSGATVSLISLRKVRETTVNEAGKFEFVGLPFGTYDLTILRPGFTPHSVENLHVSSSEPEPLSITLQVNMSSCEITPVPSYERRTDETNLAGSISDLGDGHLEHASVKVTLLKTGRTHVAITGKRGEFQFKGLEPGKYMLSVNHRGYSYFGSAINFWIASRKPNEIQHHTPSKQQGARNINLPMNLPASGNQLRSTPSPKDGLLLLGGGTILMLQRHRKLGN